MHQANGGAAEPSVGSINSHRHGQRSQRGSRKPGDAALWARGVSRVLVTAEAGDGAAFVGTAQRVADPAAATAVEVLGKVLPWSPSRRSLLLRPHYRHSWN